MIDLVNYYSLITLFLSVHLRKKVKWLWFKMAAMMATTVKAACCISRDKLFNTSVEKPPGGKPQTGEKRDLFGKS